MKYFQNFPRIEYSFTDKNGNKVKIDSVDLMLRYKFTSEVLNSPLAYYDYRWKDSDRPDIVASTYYGDADLAWIVMMSAQLFDWYYDFPLDDQEFNVMLLDQYGLTPEEAMTDVYGWKNADGFWIDQETFTTNGGTVVYTYDHLFEKNEAKRAVKLISKQYVQKIISEFESKLKTIKTSREKSLVPFMVD